MIQNKQVLQEAHLKVTHSRQVVLDMFLEAKKPISVDDILAHVDRIRCAIDKATVYRMLETFYEKGIVNRFEFGEGKYRYELAGADHHHLICEHCGAIEDLTGCNIAVLERDIRHKKGFAVRRHSLEFFGICKNCQG